MGRLKKSMYPINNGTIPAVGYECLDATFISARIYLMQSDRYKNLLQSINSTTCSGSRLRKRHWEYFVSCAACRFSWKRIDLTDMAAYQSLHFKRAGSPHLLDAILTRCFERGVAVVDFHGYNAMPASKWME